MKDEKVVEKYSEKLSPVAILLATFLGPLGAHRFYTGYYLIGFIQLFTCGGFIIWQIIDIISLFRNNFCDSNGNLLKNYSNKVTNGLACLAIIITFCWAYIELTIIDNFRVKIGTKQIVTPLDNVSRATNQDYSELIESKSENNAPIKEVKYELTSESGLNISNSATCEENKAICGTITNTSNKLAKNIVIKIELYDKNKKFIAFSEAKIYSLNAGAQWNFKAPIYYNTVASYKIIKISSN